MEMRLKAERRDDAGKGVARKIRASGRVPGVVYGHGIDPIAISVDARDLFHTLHTEAGTNVLVDLRMDGDRVLAMPREIQRDLIRGKLLHVDFIRIARDEKVSVDVPIQLVGESHGVKEGGVVEHHLWSLHLECLPQDVPPAIEADVTPIGIGESLHVSDLKLPDKLTVLNAGDEVIVSVVTPQVLQVEEEVPEEGVEVVEGEEAAEALAEAGGKTETEAESAQGSESSEG